MFIFQFVVIQAYQTPRNEGDVIQGNIIDELNKRPELEDVFLVMTAQPDEGYYATPDRSFAPHFSDQMACLDSKKCIIDIVGEAATQEFIYMDLPDNSKPFRPAAKPIIPPASTLVGNYQPQPESDDDD